MRKPSTLPSRLERQQMAKGVCLGPGGCTALTDACCPGCGWNREEHLRRLQLIQDGTAWVDGTYKKKKTRALGVG